MVVYFYVFYCCVACILFNKCYFPQMEIKFGAESTFPNLHENVLCGSQNKCAREVKQTLVA